jgi:Ca2+-binding RTX toxin-like protein
VVGTARSEFLIGTRHRDVFKARGGADLIAGRGGDDLICAGRGNDIIDGSGGRDVVWAGRGYDRCAASSSSEHRLHHSCEAHEGAPLPASDPPPSSSATPNRTLSTARPEVGARALSCGGAFCAYVWSDSAECNSGNGNFNWRLNLQGLTGRYAARPFVWHNNGRTWEYPPVYGGWEINDLPESGEWTFQDTTWGATGSPSIFAVGWQVYFWDGSGWANETVVYPDSYLLWGLFRLNYAWCYA